MTEVGLVGLNLDMANIIIIMARIFYRLTASVCSHLIVQDPCWSKQQDLQLTGRLNRHPQDKVVLIYRIVAHNSTDVYLNKIAHDKGIMQRFFLGLDGELGTFSAKQHNPLD